MNRPENLQRVRDRTEPWDIIVIGGGDTGVTVHIGRRTRMDSSAAGSGHRIAVAVDAPLGYLLAGLPQPPVHVRVQVGEADVAVFVLVGGGGQDILDGGPGDNVVIPGFVGFALVHPDFLLA
jgi:hypothetical protein